MAAELRSEKRAMANRLLADRGVATARDRIGPFPYFAFHRKSTAIHRFFHSFRAYTSAPIDTMTAQQHSFEVWRERDWRCEWWVVSGRPQVRLYLGTHKVNELAAGPEIDLQRQIKEWLRAVHADTHRT